MLKQINNMEKIDINGVSLQPCQIIVYATNNILCKAVIRGLSDTTIRRIDLNEHSNRKILEGSASFKNYYIIYLKYRFLVIDKSQLSELELVLYNNILNYLNNL